MSDARIVETFEFTGDFGGIARNKVFVGIALDAGRIFRNAEGSKIGEFDGGEIASYICTMLLEDRHFMRILFDRNRVKVPPVGITSNQGERTLFTAPTDE